jgi:hypothetical protein
MYTYLGDATMDGKVDTRDFNSLAGGFGSGSVWTSGDFDYSGSVDSVDFNLLLANYGKSLPIASAALGAVVPEPASTGLLLVGAAGLLARRRAGNTH